MIKFPSGSFENAEYTGLSEDAVEVTMGNLPKFTLTKNEQKDRWDLEQDKTGKVVKSWGTKAEATKGGVLERAIGGEGSVKIQKENGRIQEERTFPRSEDPRKSPG